VAYSEHGGERCDTIKIEEFRDWLRTRGGCSGHGWSHRETLILTGLEFSARLSHLCEINTAIRTSTYRHDLRDLGSVLETIPHGQRNTVVRKPCDVTPTVKWRASILATSCLNSKNVGGCCEIWSSHGGEGDVLLGYDAVLTLRWLPTFRRNVIVLSVLKTETSCLPETSVRNYRIATAVFTATQDVGTVVTTLVTTLLYDHQLLSQDNSSVAVWTARKNETFDNKTSELLYRRTVQLPWYHLLSEAVQFRMMIDFAEHSQTFWWLPFCFFH
jgi:hypothetical protein